MKKLLAILCVLAMLCMLCVPAFAYEGLNSLAIVGAGIPGVKDWDPADPAGEMEEVEDGVFVKELSLTAGTTMTFKFAGNDAWDDAFNFGSAAIEVGKTADLTCGSGSQNMTVTVTKDTTLKFTVNVNPMAEGGAATLLVEGDGIGEAPVVTYDSYYVAGQAGLVGQEWIVDGAKMDEVSDGIYELTFTDIPAGEYQFKVTVGNWDVSYGGDGPDGNYLITVEDTSDVTVIFDSASSTISVEMEAAEEEPPVTEPVETEPVETEPAESEPAESEPAESEPAESEPAESEPAESEPAESEPVKEEGTSLVYAKVPASWGGANCWAWSGSTNAFDTWPGEAMTLADNGWYTINIPDWCDSIIINWEGDANKTPDTTIDMNSIMWIVVAEDNTATVYYEEPSADDLTPPAESEPAETEPSDPAEEDTAAPTVTIPTQSPEQLAKQEADRIAARNKTLIILAIVLVVIIIVACILSIPKKLV